MLQHNVMIDILLWHPNDTSNVIFCNLNAALLIVDIHSIRQVSYENVIFIGNTIIKNNITFSQNDLDLWGLMSLPGNKIWIKWLDDFADKNVHQQAHRLMHKWCLYADMNLYQWKQMDAQMVSISKTASGSQNKSYPCAVTLLYFNWQILSKIISSGTQTFIKLCYLPFE